MSASPLTHHEILTLVEPFAQRGRHVDLAASDRLERRLVFKPVDHPGTSPAMPELRETMQLQCWEGGRFELTRELAGADGVQARLEAHGAQPAALLAQVEAVAPQRHFSAGPGFVVWRSYRVATGKAASSDTPELLLTSGGVRVDGLILTLTLPAVRGVSPELVLQATDLEPLDLPEDLLAVLGWDWARLIRDKSGWKTRLRLRGDERRRTRGTEAALERAAVHLARTLSEPPSCFHDRLLAARWGVVFRRAIPSLTALCLIVAVAIVPRVAQVENPGRWLLLFHLPTALLALSFFLQELPQFEIPPLPRRSGAAGWRLAPEPVAAGPAHSGGVQAG
jgi:hypothetical protein